MRFEKVLRFRGYVPQRMLLGMRVCLGDFQHEITDFGSAYRTHFREDRVEHVLRTRMNSRNSKRSSIMPNSEFNIRNICRFSDGFDPQLGALFICFSGKPFGF